MFPKTHRLCSIALSAAALACIAASAQADTQYIAQTSVSADNFATGGGSASLFDSGYPPSNFADVTLQQSFQGLNSHGVQQTMTLISIGAAQADADGLHARSAVMLSTPYYNAANPNFVTSDFNIDPTGSPTALREFTVAQMNDTLKVSAPQALSGLRLTVRLEGSITDLTGNYNWLLDNVDVGMFASTNAGGGCNDAQSDCRSTSLIRQIGTFSEDYTFDLAVGDASAVPLALALSLNNRADLNYGGYDENSSYAVSMDFSNTLKIVGFEGVDANGQAFALDSVTGASGQLYPTAAVPEPAQAWLTLVGLGGLLVRRRLQRR